MSKLRDYINIIKTKDCTAEKLKTLCNDNGYIALLTGGKSFGYTTEILPEYLQQGEVLAIPVGGAFNLKYHNGFFYNANNYILQTKENLDTKYLYYQLQNKETLIEEFYQGWGCKKLKIQSLLNLKINFPCISKQKEIVKVLDLLANLIKELETKIFDKGKQYNYYRDSLLTFKQGEVEWKRLGEVARKISSGGTPKTGVVKYYNGDIPWLRTQEVNFDDIWDTNIKITEEGLNNSSAHLIPANCVIVAMYGATVGKSAINKIPMATNQACANIEVNENIAYYRYIFHYIRMQYEHIKSLGSGSQTNINANIVRSLQIPVPPLEVQKEIVRILDNFTNLTTQLTEELTKELTARRKQYEYYRNELLNFENL